MVTNDQLSFFPLIYPIFLHYIAVKYSYLISLVDILIYIFKICIFSITHQRRTCNGKAKLLIKQQTENVSFLSQLAEPLNHGRSGPGLTFT